MYLRSKIKRKTGETKVWISLEGTKTTTFNTLLLYFLEKEMAAHSSILAWRTPWTEEPAAVAKSLQSCPTLCNIWTVACPWNSPGKSTGVGCHFLLQWVFPTQGLNLGLLTPV